MLPYLLPLMKYIIHICIDTFTVEMNPDEHLDFFNISQASAINLHESWWSLIHKASVAMHISIYTDLQFLSSHHVNDPCEIGVKSLFLVFSQSHINRSGAWLVLECPRRRTSSPKGFLHLQPQQMGGRFHQKVVNRLMLLQLLCASTLPAVG